MEKKYLMKGMAALALLASVSSCVSDVDAPSQAELDAKAKENAEIQLGITIPDGQTWDMSAQVSTDITVNLGVDLSYTVGIYDVDPRFSKKSTFYALEKVSEGGTLNTTITLPKAMNLAYVTVYDSQLNLKTVKPVSVVDGAIETNVGGVSRRAMRAADTWTESHSDAWMDDLDFKLPAKYTTVVKGPYSDYVDIKSANSPYYVPEDFDGILNFDNYNGDIYIAGKIKQLGGNPGKINVYVLESGSWEVGVSTGTLTIYNRGELNLPSWALNNQNTKTIYNGGSLKIGDGKSYPDFADGVSIYSNGEGTIEIVGKTKKDYDWETGTDLKFNCDVHGTMKVTGDLKIQNSKTQYVCGLIVSGHLEMAEGNLQTSYVEANDIKFDGASIWLLPEGHILAKEKFYMPNSASHVYGYEGSYGLVETKDFYLENKNFFSSDAFSNNIYFKVKGCVDAQNCSTLNGHWNTVGEYVAERDPGLYARVNVDNVYGTPECSDSFGDVPEEEEPGIEGDPAVYTYAFEDQYVNGDYDMNDVVLKVSHPYTIANGEYNYDTSKLNVKLVAAGATFNIKVKIGDTYLFNGEEIHKVLGVNAGVMVNTGGTGTQNGVAPKVCQIDAPAGWDGDFNNLDVKIEVLSTKDVIAFVTETPKVAPFSVMIPSDWAWPTERTNVMDAYEGFGPWAEAETRTDALNRWYETPVSGKVVSNQ